jgi:glucose-6-phosphate 1-dehydrogenase
VGIKSARWKNVPFILESGKGMKESKTEIIVYFKKTLGAQPNTIHFRIQPNEGIDLNFWIKKPGFEQEYEEKTLSFSYNSTGVMPDAYERVLFDCVRGDQTLFASTEEVTYSWKFITPLLVTLQKEPLMPYTKHTNGPLVSE